MRQVLLILTLLTGVVVNMGCDRASSSQADTAVAKASATAAPSKLAIIDLDKIAKQMDWYDTMQRRVGALDQELQVKLEGLRVQWDTMLRDEQKRIGDKPTQEQQDRLEAMRLVAQRKLQEAQLQAQQETARLRSEVIAQFRDLIRPVAERVAQSQGIGVILLPSEMIFWNEITLDITQTVVDELKRTGVKPSLETADSKPAESTQP